MKRIAMYVAMIAGVLLAITAIWTLCNYFQIPDGPDHWFESRHKAFMSMTQLLAAILSFSFSSKLGEEIN